MLYLTLFSSRSQFIFIRMITQHCTVQSYLSRRFQELYNLVSALNLLAVTVDNKITKVSRYDFLLFFY